MVSFSVGGRSQDTGGYLAVPQQRTGPGLVVIQEWWGLVDHVRDLTDRFAAEGFVALAPDLYHGKQTRSPDEAGKLLMALNIPEAAKDIEGAASFLRTMDEVSPKKVGAIGFCMGGQLALYTAIESPNNISAAVDFYGIHPNVQLSPERLSVPVLLHFGKKDKSIPEAGARELAESLKGSGMPVEAFFYEAGHAFFNDSRPEAYVAEEAQLAWQRTLAFLGAYLT